MTGPARQSLLQRRSAAVRLLAGAVGLVLAAYPALAIGQQTSPIGLLPGNAAVTGFSGVVRPSRIARGADPSEATFIDTEAPSLRIVDLHHMGGLPLAQLVGAPKPFIVRAKDIGQVFGVTLDSADPANVYVAASSAYGLPIVVPGPGGRLRHIRAGAARAMFMPGLWGAAAPDGGPGTIWKIDGATGTVSRFADVSAGDRENSGAALGALAFDPQSGSLFVSDRETGYIDRFASSGTLRDRYDHGVSGREAQGLAAVPWNPAPRVTVTDPGFDSTNPATWNYAVPERRVFGLAVFRHRLYYAVADGQQIWSVGLKEDGSFGGDAVIEVAVPPAAGPTEISKITFDEDGRMLLAERPAPTGAFDFEALAYPAVGRVLRYQVVGIASNGRPIWQADPDEFSIGFAGDFRNGNGGVEIGYRYDDGGEFDRGACGGFLWATGEQLRKSSDPALAARLAQRGPEIVDGLQGNGSWDIRRHDEPPLRTYFIDYDDQFDDAGARGHLGDLAILRACSAGRGAELETGSGGAGLAGGLFWQLPPKGNPPGSCPPGQVLNVGTGTCQPSCTKPGIQIGGKCCEPKDLTAGGLCSNTPPHCPPGQTATGAAHLCCKSDRVYIGANGGPACCEAPVANGKCEPSTPPPCTPGDPKCGGASNPPQCPPGSTALAPDNKCCPDGDIYIGASGARACCGGAAVGGKCEVPFPPPCTPGDPKCGGGNSGSNSGNVVHPACGPDQTSIPPSNFCCDKSNVYTDTAGAPACCSAAVVNGQCGTPPPTPSVPFPPSCPPGSTNAKCCGAGYVPSGAGCCLASQMTSKGVCCPAGQSPGGANNSQCQPRIHIPNGPKCCQAGYVPTAGGNCCPLSNVTTSGACCPGPVDVNDRSSCPATPQERKGCAPGYVKMKDGSCRRAPPRQRAAPPAEEPPGECPPGTVRSADRGCVEPGPPPGYAPPPPPPPYGQTYSPLPSGQPFGTMPGMPLFGAPGGSGTPARPSGNPVPPAFHPDRR